MLWHWSWLCVLCCVFAVRTAWSVTLYSWWHCGPAGCSSVKRSQPQEDCCTWSPEKSISTDTSSPPRNGNASESHHSVFTKYLHAAFEAFDEGFSVMWEFWRSVLWFAGYLVFTWLWLSFPLSLCWLWLEYCVEYCTSTFTSTSEDLTST